MRRNRLSSLAGGVFLSVMLLVLSCAPAAPRQEGLTIGGGSIGGITNLLASATSALLNKYMDTESTVISATMMGMPGRVANRVMDVGATGPDVAYEAYAGTGPFEGEQAMEDLRTLCYHYVSYYQIFVVKDSPIQEVSEFVGRRVCPGLKGMTVEQDFKDMIAPGAGISYDDLNIEYMGHKDGGSALVAGKIDVYIASAGIPHPTFAEVDLTRPIRLVSLTEAEAQYINEEVPFWSAVRLEPDYYHMEEPALVPVRPFATITTADLPEDVAYGIVKNWVEHPEFVGYYHQSFQSMIESGVYRDSVETQKMGCPYHAGAYRYFTEQGWEVPPDRIPSEAT